MTEQKSTDNGRFAALVGLAAATCFVFAVLSHFWLVNASGDVRFGLRHNLQCAGQVCAKDSNAHLVEQVKQMSGNAPDMASDVFAPMGWATTIACALAALGLITAAALALSRFRPTLPISPSTVALLSIMVSLITGCVFVATKPGGPGFVGVGLSFWVFGAGAVAGIAGAQMLAKINRAPDPDLMADAMNPDDF
jgi:hypothetical protein